MGGKEDLTLKTISDEWKMSRTERLMVGVVCMGTPKVTTGT